MIMQTPTLYSSSQNWIEWHAYLKKNLGTKDANQLFMEHWAKIGQGSNANDAALRSYLKSQGIQVEGEYFLLSGLADTWQSTNTGFKKIGSSANLGVFIVIIMIVVAVYFLFIKN